MSPGRSFCAIIILKGGRFMKKILGIIISFFVLIGITGCISDSETNKVVTDTDGNSKTIFNLNETAIFDNVHYTVTNIEYSNGEEYDKPAEGKNYVIVTLKIENKSGSKISYNALDWKMLNSQGQEDDEAFTIINSDTSLNSGDLADGGTKTGTLVYEQSQNETSLKLLYYADLFWDEKATFEVIIK